MTSLFLIMALVLAPSMAEKKRDWKEATIIDVRYEQKIDDVSGDQRTGGATTRTLKDTWTYIVESEGTRYELQEQDTKASFATGGTLRFAIEKKTWYFTDAKGKERKGDVVGRKELKKP